MRVRLALASLLVASCMAKVKPVIMPSGEHALRIECNYEFANCERKARQECDGDYDRITRGDASCPDCGLDDVTYSRHEPLGVPSEQGPSAGGSSVYTGVLYVRCR